MERIHISNIDKTDITIIKTSEITVMMDYKREYFDQFVCMSTNKVVVVDGVRMNPRSLN